MNSNPNNADPNYPEYSDLDNQVGTYDNSLDPKGEKIYYFNL